MEKKVTSHIIKGFLIGLVMVVISIIFQVFDIRDSWTQWLVLGLLAAAIIWSGISYSKDMDGNVTFGNVFAHGFKTAVIVTIVGIASFVITYLIMPEIKEKALQAAREQMEKDPKNTEQTIDTAIKMVDKFFLAFGIGGTLFSNILVGCISGLIGAAVAKKNPNSGMPQTM